MNNRSKVDKKNLYFAIMGLMIIMVGLFGTYFLIKYFVKVLVVYSPETKTVVIAGFLTLFGTIFSIIYTKHKEKTLQIEQEQRRQTAEIYTQFIEFLFKMINQERLNKQISEKEIIEFMTKFYKVLIVWGSDEVIKEFSNLKKKMDSGGVEMALELGKMLILIRKELGHKNTGLSEKDLLSVFIKDFNTSRITAK